MNVSARTQTLLDRLPPNHRLTPTMRTAMIAVLAASDEFTAHKSQLARDGRLTHQGRQQALREALSARYGKDLIRAREPIIRARAEHTARKSALTIKPVDPTNLAAALERSEIRAWVRTLDLGVRQSVVLATKDRRILEAVVSAPPELSGFAGDAAFASKVEDHYIEIVYPGELEQHEADDGVIAQGEAAVGISFNEMRVELSADMHPRDFDTLMGSVVDRPWLTSDSTQVVGVDAAGKAFYRPATAADKANGIKYENFEAYKAAQGLADRAA